MKRPSNRLFNEDCIAGMRKLADGCVDLAFADPPFNIGYDYDVYDDGRDSESYLGWCKQWISGVHRALKDSFAMAAEHAHAVILMDQVDLADTGVVTADLLEAVAQKAAANPDLLMLADSRRSLKNWPPVAMKMKNSYFVQPLISRTLP